MKIASAAFAATGVMLLLAGCTPEPKAPATATVDAKPSMSWDGMYRGSIQVTGLGSGIEASWCETDPQMLVRVSSAAFSYAMPHPNAPGNPTPVYSGNVASDGTFTANLGSGTMAGRITGDRMEGKIDGSVCVYSFAMTRS
jgi:hypothetical protein